MDPAHIPFAHHGLQGVRSDGCPIPMRSIKNAVNYSHVEVSFEDTIREKPRTGIVSFQVRNCEERSDELRMRSLFDCASSSSLDNHATITAHAIKLANTNLHATRYAPCRGRATITFAPKAEKTEK